uniref:G-protein coupled receptors family 1 profile domain-containing protein n=1 Tax=Rhipicephalus appendiculatus TaxID=34631 RepID=A0A131YY43_RHIAP
MRSASGTGGSSNASAGLVTQGYDVWFDVEAATTSATAAAAVVDGPTPVHLLCTSLAATVGLVLNAYILVVLFWQRQFRTANSLLLLHLAFVDSVFCLLVLASNAVFGGLSASAEVIDASGACYVQGVLWAVVPAVAVWTLCGLSCDRYAAIASPLHYSRLVNTRRTCAFLGVSWVVAAGAAVPPLVGVCPYSYGPSRCVCVAACAGSGVDLQAPASSPVGLGYALSYVWLALVFPASLIAASNLQVLLIARTHRHRIVAAIYEVTLRAQATVTHQRNPWYLARFRGRSALLSTAQLVASLALLTAPHFALLLWEASTGRRTPPLLGSATTALLCWSPCAHAYVYGVRSRALRQTFKDLLRRHVYRQQVCREAARRASAANGGTPGRPKLIRRFSAPDGLGSSSVVMTNARRALPRRASEKCMLLRTGSSSLTTAGSGGGAGAAMLCTAMPSSAPSSRRSLLMLEPATKPSSRASVFPLILEHGLSEEDERGPPGGCLRTDDEDDDLSRSRSPPSRATPDSTDTRSVWAMAKTVRLMHGVRRVRTNWNARLPFFRFNTLKTVLEVSVV